MGLRRTRDERLPGEPRDPRDVRRPGDPRDPRDDRGPSDPGRIRRDILRLFIGAPLIAVLAVVVGVGRVQQIANKEVRDVKTVARSVQVLEARGRYELCVAVNANSRSLHDIVEQSFAPGTPIDPAKLPPRARMLYVELVPILVAFNAGTAGRKVSIEEAIQKPLTCVRPAGVPPPTTAPRASSTTRGT